jgi:hypothetical protein
VIAATLASTNGNANAKAARTRSTPIITRTWGSRSTIAPVTPARGQGAHKRQRGVLKASPHCDTVLASHRRH